MEVLRSYSYYRLNKGDGMARGLFNVVNDKEMKESDEGGVSMWFDEETKDELMQKSDVEFAFEAQELINNTI